MSTKGNKIKNLSDLEKSYIAGFIDGEGCLTISRHPSKDGTKNPYKYSPWISVTNTNLEVMVWLKDITGLGHISLKSFRNIRHKDAYHWAIWSNQAFQLLEVLQPFLKVKAPQCKLLLEFYKRKRNPGKVGLTKEEWDFQTDVYQNIKILNKRGK